MRNPAKLSAGTKIFGMLLPVLIVMLACTISTPPDSPALLPANPQASSPGVATLTTTLPKVKNPQAKTPVGKTPTADNPGAPAQPVCPNGDCANLCVDRETTFQPYTGKPGSPPKSKSRIGGPDNSIVLTTYQINGDQISSPTNEPNVPANLESYQNDTTTHQKLWQYYSTIIPADQRARLNQFIIFTDGVGGILASVSQTSNDTAHWALRIDILDSAYPRDLTYTLLHEFGHLLTLNDSQVTPDMAVMTHPDDAQIFQTEAANCPQFFAENGCSQPTSYINLFFQKFWGQLYPRWVIINNEKDQKNYMNLLGQFYLNNQSKFVSEYAITSPEEDIAETWAKFIFSRKPNGSDIASQKVLFFYSFPELVDLRTRIVNGICSFTKK